VIVATERRLGPSAAGATGVLVRRLGAFERMEHRYQESHTMHFCMVTELAEHLDAAALEAGPLQRSTALKAGAAPDWVRLLLTAKTFRQRRHRTPAWRTVVEGRR
jgi:hypothetical protein